MDAAIRCIREGRTSKDAPAALVVVEDRLETVGGCTVFRELVSKLSEHIECSRSQATAARLVLVDAPDRFYDDITRPSVWECIDCFSDPHGWSRTNTSDTATGQPLGLFNTKNPCETLTRRLLLRTSGVSSSGHAEDTAAQQADVPQGHLCIVLDCLSTLMLHAEEGNVLSMLGALRQHPAVSSLVTLMHADLHAPHVVRHVDSLASCTVHLDSCPQLEAELAVSESGMTPHGRFVARFKRNNGRVRVETELYCLKRDGLATFPPPTGEATARALASKSTKVDKGAGSEVASASAASAQLPQQFAGGMKLTMSKEEREAKDKVLLPYEQVAHMDAEGRPVGRSTVAEGTENTSRESNLGHILYVRDTDSEYDSDEDPDDDLDI